MREDGEYDITIEEGSEFTFFQEGPHCPGNKYYYIGEKDNSYICLVCKEAIDKLFLIPEKDKRYDITVKKVK